MKAVRVCADVNPLTHHNRALVVLLHVTAARITRIIVGVTSRAVQLPGALCFRVCVDLGQRWDASNIAACAASPFASIAACATRSSTSRGSFHSPSTTLHTTSAAALDNGLPSRFSCFLADDDDAPPTLLPLFAFVVARAPAPLLSFCGGIVHADLPKLHAAVLWAARDGGN